MCLGLLSKFAWQHQELTTWGQSVCFSSSMSTFWIMINRFSVGFHQVMVVLVCIDRTCRNIWRVKEEGRKVIVVTILVIKTEQRKNYLKRKQVRGSETVIESVGCWSYRVKESRNCHEILIHIRVHINFKNFSLFSLWFPLHPVFPLNTSIFRHQV